MKALRIVMLPMVMLFASGAVLADSDDKNGEDWSDFSKMMTERSKMLRETMMITRETMKIVRDMNHHPSAAEKDKLDKMIKEMNGMMEHEADLGKKMMKKWKKEDWGSNRDDM